MFPTSDGKAVLGLHSTYAEKICSEPHLRDMQQELKAHSVYLLVS